MISGVHLLFTAKMRMRIAHSSETFSGSNLWMRDMAG